MQMNSVVHSFEDYTSADSTILQIRTAKSINSRALEVDNYVNMLSVCACVRACVRAHNYVCVCPRARERVRFTDKMQRQRKLRNRGRNIWTETETRREMRDKRQTGLLADIWDFVVLGIRLPHLIVCILKCHNSSAFSETGPKPADTREGKRSSEATATHSTTHAVSLNMAASVGTCELVAAVLAMCSTWNLSPARSGHTPPGKPQSHPWRTPVSVEVGAYLEDEFYDPVKNLL